MDKYDLAVQYLKEHPEEIGKAWDQFADHEAGCLFLFCTKNGVRSWGERCGCLTQIRFDPSLIAFNRELTQEIRQDTRIPTRPEDIRIDDLPVFAEWQRRLDKEREKLNA